jgi:hypothetical protein
MLVHLLRGESPVVTQANETSGRDSCFAEVKLCQRRQLRVLNVTLVAQGTRIVEGVSEGFDGSTGIVSLLLRAQFVALLSQSTRRGVRMFVRWGGGAEER